MASPPGITPNFPGQSNAPLTLNEIKVTAGGRSSAMNNPPRSADHISGAVRNINDYLVYPHDIPKYFMHFAIYEYNRPNFRDVGSLGKWNGGTNQIYLPLSEALQDNLQANWETKPIPWMVGGLSEMLSGLKENPIDLVKKMYNQTKEFAGAVVAGDTSKFSKSDAGAAITRLAASGDAVLGSNIGESIGALTGFAPNQFMTVLFIGPEYKQHNFSWNFSPRDKDESETLRRILNVFKKAMSPTVHLGGMVWGYPCIFRIMFRPNNEQLYKFKPMCLKDFKVNWAPAGRASFYRGLGAPEGVNVSATFLEMEYWHQEAMREQPERDVDIEVNRDGKNNPV